VRAVRPVTAIALLVACLGLVACGSDDDDRPAATETIAEPEARPEGEGKASDADDSDGDGRRAPSAGGLSVEEVVELVLTSRNPEDACLPPHVTPGYVRSAYGDERGCLQALGSGGAIAKSVEVEPVDESGESATATALARGGPYDGEEIEVELVKSGANWSVDRVEVDVPAGP
jgi:hypothetical protein